jgi:ribosome maturation factor RimP
MKKAQVLLAIGLVLGLLFSAANVFAGSSADPLVKPNKTPGAKATEKAIEQATQGKGNHGHGHGKKHNYKGVVAAVGGDSLTLTLNDGSSATFAVPAGTKIKIPSLKDATLADVPVGASASVAASEAEDGSLTALSIHVQLSKTKHKKMNYKGTVAAVGGASLSLTIQDGSTVNFAVSEGTRIKIPSLGKDATLADVNVGVNALVRASEAEDGSLTALDIHVTPGKPQRIHRVGTVTEYTPGVSITIETKNGETTTFALTGGVKILPEDRVDELEVGSLVTIISRRDVTGGELTAQGIVVHPSVEEGEADDEGTPEITQTPSSTLTPGPTKTPKPTESEDDDEDED